MKFLNVLAWIWQLPQHIVACIVFLFNKKSLVKHTYEGITYYTCKHVYDCGVCLGNYIFLDSDTHKIYNEDVLTKFMIDSVRHEYGHSRQSLYLGWFYVFIIGFPSLIGNLVDRILYGVDFSHRSKCHYYDQPWEYWADKLGGVDRKKA